MKTALYKYLILPVIFSGLMVGCCHLTSLDCDADNSFPANAEEPSSEKNGLSETFPAEKKSLTQERLQLGDIRVPFLPNYGQMDAKVKYYAKTFGGTLFVTEDGELVYSLPINHSSGRKKTHDGEKGEKQLVLVEKLGNGSSKIVPTRPSTTNVSILHGDDPLQWQHDVPSFQEISLGNVYPGIEVRLAAHANSVEKLFYVSSGVPPQDIEIAVSKGAKLSVAEGGQLDILTEAGRVQFSRPIAWQDIEGIRKYVDVAYTVDNDHADIYSFDVGRYDHRYPLVIDPLLQSTYLGGSSNDEVSDIAIGPNGNIYVVGDTSSSDFPICSGQICFTPVDNDFGGTAEAFVARISSDLTTLLQTTYLGGSGSDYAEALVTDGSGNVYVTGSTYSADFPGITGGADTTVSDRDGFVTRLTADLRTITQSTFVGGSSSEFPRDIAISKANEILIAGTTYSNDLPNCSPILSCFPITRPDPDFAGASEGFVARLNLGLTTSYTTYLGGNNRDDIYGLAVAEDGHDIYICGTTNSSIFPFIDNGVDTIQQDYEAFVTRMKDDLATNNTEQSTYYGGSGYEECYAIVMGVDGQVYITGETNSVDLPHCSGSGCPSRGEVFSGGSEDAYVAKLSTNLQYIYGSTYLGGTGFEMGSAIAVIPAPWNPWENIVYVAGDTTSADFLKAKDGADSSFDGSSEGFVAYLNNALSKIEQTTYIGGNNDDVPTALAISGTGDIYVAGQTRSSDFPMRQKGFDTVLNGTEDAFIAKFSNLKGDARFYTIPVKNGKAVIIHID